MPSANSLDAADCAIFGVLTAMGYLVGLHFSSARRRRQVAAGEASSASAALLEAFLGSRSLPAGALTVSVFASLANGIAVVGYVGHHYGYGFHMVWVLLLGPVAVALMNICVVPLLYKLHVTSIFEYLRMRFDNKVGITACGIYFLLSQTLGAVGIYTAAIGVSIMSNVPLLYSNIIIGLAGAIYSALGGLRCVVWADCVQALVMFASPLTIIGKVFYDSIHATPPLRSMRDYNLTEFAFRTNIDISSDENVWSSLVAALPFVMVRMGFDQMAVQRFMAARSLRDARRIVLGGVASVLLFFTMVSLSGAAMIYWYRDCDPLLHGDVKTYDQIVPFFMKESLSNIAMLRGLFLAGLLSASTSTVSSVVNSNAATFYVDILGPHVKMSEQRAVFVVRLLAFASGFTMTIFAVAVPVLGTATRLFLSLYSSASGPFVGLVLLALSSPWVNAKGAAWASILVCGLQLWHAVGRIVSRIPPPPALQGTLDRCPPRANGTDTFISPATLLHGSQPSVLDVFPLYQVSFLWISLFGCLLTIILGTALSVATGGARQSRKNLRLTSPAFLNLWRRCARVRGLLEVDETKGVYFTASSALEDAGGDYATVVTGLFPKDDSCQLGANLLEEKLESSTCIHS